MSNAELDRLRYRARTLQRRAAKRSRNSSYWKEADKALKEYHRAKELLREQNAIRRDE